MTNENSSYDLVVVGGGINGAGIARDAAGRGLRVLLCERDDIAAHTSSASTKLIHGGLRYLEHYEFSLVRKALREREVLLKAAPHIIWPMRFVMPHTRSLRPRWMIRAGLFLYDHLGGRSRLPGSRSVKLAFDPAGQPLRPEFTDGFAYSDCWVQDSRLVVLNALDAAERGAEVLTHTACVGARRDDDLWTVALQDQHSGANCSVRARALVNAAGPWVSRFLESVTGRSEHADGKHVRLVKGSHLVVPRLFEHDQAYLLQNDDRRVIFVIPYEHDYTLIGTTDETFEGDPRSLSISDAETEYLCDTINHYFKRAVTPADVVWSYAGVRPLYDDAAADASAVTRDYVLDLDADGGQAPLLSVFGGKITTYRTLAEDVLAQLAGPLGLTARPWTATEALPGGDIPAADFDAWLAGLANDYPFLPPDLLWRYARNYGTRMRALVGEAQSLTDLGEHLGDGMYTAELDYLIRYEWARTADDALWRRSRMGLHVSEATRQAIDAWFSQRGAPEQQGLSREAHQAAR
ncbi:glycerol-3-phosphate dehydrogenase [Aquisalimonas sp. APHAB1-3]|uniref:glycerol-3-phosphate dehydrogenase n=1 Tax=Aquisalimonas sp. APHAB1-3 TaxID=3402080 RepID=UPI003AADC5DD